MIKELAKHIGEYKKVTILTPIVAAVEVALEVLIPLVLARLIDLGIDMGDMAVIKRYGAYLIGLTIL